MKLDARRTWLSAALALSICLWPALTAAHDTRLEDPPVPESPSCKFCKSSGREVCGEHPAGECASEDDVLFCSRIVDCPVCAGTGWVVCRECKSEVAQATLDKKKADVQKRRIALKALDDKMGRELWKVETAHFVLVWELERIKVDKKFLNQHEGMHLYAKRLERLYADYLARLKLVDKDFRDKFKVFIWGWPKDHEAGSLAFCGQNALGGVKLMGSNPAYSVCGIKRNFNDDDQLHRNIVHSVTHLMLSAQKFPAWMGNVKGGWCDEGLAHWFEDRYWGICDNYCFQESNNNVDFKGGKFRLAMRKLIELDKAPSAAQVFERTSDTLTLPEHAVAFSFVDYFLSRDGEKFSALCSELKHKVPTRDALKKVYDMSVIEFEALWKAWVLQTYPTK